MADASRRFNQSLTDLNSEDFLFQLYHGAELLHDSRVHEAKEAIEAALRLQPRDPKGQNLLGLVYFRLGVYPHAIGIFEELVRDYPTEPAPRINLALCFLKTGQAELARNELEEVTRLDPVRDRAWAYLGLAYERLDNPEKAQAAWARAGRFSLSKRGQHSTSPTEVSPAPAENTAAQIEELNEVRRVADQAFLELDGPSFSFSIAPPAPSFGAWSAVETKEHQEKTRRSDTELVGRPDPVAVLPRQPSSSPAPAAPASLVYPEPSKNSVQAFSKIHSICPEESTRLLADGSMAFWSDGGAWLREELLVAVSNLAAAEGEGTSYHQEMGCPMFELGASAFALLRPSCNRVLLPVSQGPDDVLYINRDLLAGISSSMRIDAGQIPIGESQTIPMLKVSGAGQAILQLPKNFGTMPLLRGLEAKIGRESILGWYGHLRLRPYSLATSAFLREWLVVEGEGTVLVQTSSPTESGRYY